MRAVREIRPPGVYPAAEELRAQPLTVADTRVAGFVGLAARGPLDVPVLVGNWQEFVDLYGLSNDGYLARSVEGFFLNGGRSCYVVRVAHRPSPGVTPGPEHAACAERIIKDGWDKPTLAVRAINEGRWGNNVWVRCQQTTAAKTLLTLDLELGTGEATVNSIKGFERGTLVRIYDREHSDYVILSDVDDGKVRWSSATPIVRNYRAAGPTYLEVMEFEVYASLKDRREVFRGLQISPLSRRYAPRVVNAESHLVRLVDLQSTASLPHNLPQAEPPAKLQGGRDGIETLTADDFVGYDAGPDARTGLMALGHVEQVALISVPDIMLSYMRSTTAQADRDVQRVQDAMIDLCERTQDRFAILDVPPTKDIEEVRRWRKRLTTSYAALYYPWVATDGNSSVMCPPSGHVAGLIARCDTVVGVHKAPANETLAGTVNLMLNVNEDHLGLLNGDGINVVRGLPGRGIRVWGARTTSDDPDWRHINVRRLFIMLRRALETGTQWVAFEPNTPRTWEQLSLHVDDFLKGLWTNGYFAGDSPEASYFVRCDAATNTADEREAGRMVTEIGVAPAIPAEYLIFNVVQKMGDQAQAG